MTTATAPVEARRQTTDLERRFAMAAIGLTCVLYACAAIVIWIPSFDDVRVVPTVLAPVTLFATLTAFVLVARRRATNVQRVFSVAALALWTLLIFDDDRWSITIMAVYVLAWSANGRLGPFLAIAATVAWSAGWLYSGASVGFVAIPVSVLVASFFSAWASDRIAEDNQTKDRLIANLEASRERLAEAERERGALAERARLASEVHDTLAQGFTSIVLLGRVGQRTGSETELFEEIETTALTNLDAARRLVENARPVELDDQQLAEALRRHLQAAIGADRSTMTVDGEPRSHLSSVEVAAFRAVQEALLNAQRHSAADRVHVRLHHFDDELRVEIADDGIGFDPEMSSERTGVSGGQGLRAMRDRIASLGGDVRIESAPGAGATVSVRIPSGPTP